MRTELKITIPINFMNTAVTTDNYFVADTNDSTNWQKLKFPLPSGKWGIYSIETTILVDDDKDKCTIVTLKHKCSHNSSSSWGQLTTCLNCGYKWIKDDE
jgi:lysophospholipid acyltransferase (LPLAT)-like uncharacterized protein